MQLYDPLAFVHTALTSQSTCPVKHSSTSEERRGGRVRRSRKTRRNDDEEEEKEDDDDDDDDDDDGDDGDDDDSGEWIIVSLFKVALNSRERGSVFGHKQMQLLVFLYKVTKNVKNL